SMPETLYDAYRRPDLDEVVDDLRLGQRQAGTPVRSRPGGHVGVAVHRPAAVPVGGEGQPGLVRHRPGVQLLAVDLELAGRRAEVRAVAPDPGRGVHDPDRMAAL